MLRRTRLAVAAVTAALATAPRAARGDETLEDLCAHLPHLDSCDGVEPAPFDDVAQGVIRGGFRVGLVDDPEAMGGVERLYVLEHQLMIGRPGNSIVAVWDVGFGGSSGGGVFGRVEVGAGYRVHLRDFDAEAWASFGGDGLSQDRIPFSLLLGVGTQATIRLPRLAVTGRVERFIRGWRTIDPADPTTMTDRTGVLRYSALVALGHKLPNQLSSPMYTAPYLEVEIEDLPGGRVTWINVGASHYFGELPR
ncbi:MAG: hypothetical protein H6708_30155 [Kofleriaceae bacterium]|nr:hypothetical protein [Kofleriaceae bacterium]